MLKTKKRSLILTLGTMLAVVVAMFGGFLLAGKTALVDPVHSDSPFVKADEPTIVQSGNGWSLNSNGLLYIEKSAAETNAKPWSSYRSSIYEVVIADDAEYIYGKALQNCSNVKKLTMPSIVIKAQYYSSYTDVNHIGFLFDSGTNIGQVYVDGSSYRNNVKMEPSVKEIVITTGNVRNYWFNSLESVEKFDLSAISGNIGYAGFGGYSGMFSGCSALKEVIFPQNCTTMHYRAFEDCSSLQSITIPASVVKVVDNYGHDKEFSFKNCNSLTTIVVEAGNTVFDSRNNCNAIIKTATNKLIVGADPNTIPNDIVSIGDNAFSGRSGSSSTLVLPNSITSIGSYAFANCTGITSITIPNTVTNINVSAFSRCNFASVTYTTSVAGKYNFVNGAMTVLSEDNDWQNLPDELVLNIDFDSNVNNIDYSFGSYTYSYERLYWTDETTGVKYLKTRTNDYFAVAGVGDKTLTTYTINTNAKFVLASAFYNCNNLISIEIPNNIVGIGKSAFSWCNSMTSIALPEDLAYIGNNVFCRCEALTTIDIPESVFAIEDYAFQSCVNLETVTGGVNVEIIGAYAFTNCSKLKSISETINIATIGSYAFQNCAELETLAVSNNVRDIKATAFYGCEKLVWTDETTNIKYLKTTINDYFAIHSVLNKTLSNYTINDTTVLILEGAFEDCNEMASIVIPNSVKAVANGAFRGVKLESVSLGAGLVIDCDTFSLTSDGTLTILQGFDSEDVELICSEIVLKLIISENVEEEIFSSISFPNVREASLPSNWSLDNFSSLFEGADFPTIYYHGEAIPEMWGDNACAFYSADCDAETGETYIVGGANFVMYVPDENYEAFETFCAVCRMTFINYEFYESYIIILPMSFSSYGKLDITQANNGIYVGNEQNPYLVLVEEIDKSASTFKINSKTKIINSFAFYAYGYYDDNWDYFEGESGLSKTDIPDSVQYIGSCAFANCLNLTTLGIGKNVKYIGLGAFSVENVWNDDIGDYESPELSTLNIYLRKSNFATNTEATKFATDLASSLTNKYCAMFLYDYVVYGEEQQEDYSAYEYIISDSYQGYNSALDMTDITMRPVVLNYREELQEVFEDVFGGDVAQYTTLNATNAEGVQFPVTGVVFNISLAVISMIALCGMLVVVARKKEQY